MCEAPPTPKPVVIVVCRMPKAVNPVHTAEGGQLYAGRGHGRWQVCATVQRSHGPAGGDFYDLSAMRPGGPKWTRRGVENGPNVRSQGETSWKPTLWAAQHSHHRQPAPKKPTMCRVSNDSPASDARCLLGKLDASPVSHNATTATDPEIFEALGAGFLARRPVARRPGRGAASGAVLARNRPLRPRCSARYLRRQRPQFG